METDSASEAIINNSEFGVEGVHGLTLLTAAVFIVGEMSGTGVLSLPSAMVNSGWAGLGMILSCCLVSAYCGIKLSSCWVAILKRNESFRYGVRDPFPVIAYEACGNVGRICVLVASYVQLIGVAVIFLILASENIYTLISSTGLHFCDWTIILTVLMVPVSMLGTPKDFWPIAVGAMVFTGIACLFIFIETLRQNVSPLPEPGVITFKSFFFSFGTILFCFGGAVMFPTIQADMKNPSHFSKSVLVAYSIMLCFYLPVALGGFIIFGGNTFDNIIKNMNKNWLKTTVIVLITGHLLTAFNIILNPVFQGLEHTFSAPNEFSLKRVIIRTSTLIGVLFIAQTIPNFGPILSLIGGSTVSLSSFIFPLVFYFFLSQNREYNIYISKLELLLMLVCIIVSVVGGIASTYSSIDALFDSRTFVPPCYVNRTQ